MATVLTEKMRAALRIANTGEAITGEINDVIEACKADLAATGVETIDETDFNGKGEQYRQSYDLQKMSLCLDMDYNGGRVSETDTQDAGAGA